MKSHVLRAPHVLTTFIQHIRTTLLIFVCLILVSQTIYRYLLDVNTLKKQRNENHITIEYRDFKNVNTDELLEDLQSTPWEAFVFDDINDVLSSVEQIAKRCYRPAHST